MAAYNKFEYRRASHEKFRAAVDAHNSEHFAVAHYLAGVAVECMLRAYHLAVNPVWDEKHNLEALMRKSRVLEIMPAPKQPLVRTAIVEVARRWAVRHRYAPQDRLAAYLRASRLEVGPNILRRNSELMLKCTETILRECDQRCP